MKIIGSDEGWTWLGHVVHAGDGDVGGTAQYVVRVVYT